MKCSYVRGHVDGFRCEFREACEQTTAFVFQTTDNPLVQRGFILNLGITHISMRRMDAAARGRFNMARRTPQVFAGILSWRLVYNR